MYTYVLLFVICINVFFFHICIYIYIYIHTYLSIPTYICVILGQHAAIIGWGLPPAPDLAQSGFYFCLLWLEIGDWRLEIGDWSIEKKNKTIFPQPTAREIRESANPNERQREEG